MILEEMNVHSVIYPVKTLITGQEVRKFPLLFGSHGGKERKEQWGIILALTLKHEVAGFLIMGNKLVLATWT